MEQQLASLAQPSSLAQPVEELGAAASPLGPASEPAPLASEAGLALVPSAEPMASAALAASALREQPLQQLLTEQLIT